MWPPWQLIKWFGFARLAHAGGEAAWAGLFLGGDLPGPLERLELEPEDLEPEPELELVDPDPELLDPEPIFERELEAGDLAISAVLYTRSVLELEPLRLELVWDSGSAWGN